MASVVNTSFKVELMTGTHNFTASTGDVLKVALFTGTVQGAAVTAYATTIGGQAEVSGTGYSAGGATITTVTPTSSGTTALVDFNDVSWGSASFSATWAIIYNSSKSNKAIAIIDFGGTQTVSSGTFTIQWPTPDASNAIIRIS